MKIGHIAIWTNKLEEMRSFYTTYFNGISNSKYINEKKGFESYFITFEGETTLEIMRRKDIVDRIDKELLGFCHLAFTFETKEEVCSKTEQLRKNGYIVAGETRVSGDGFFESVILDVDGNRIELLAR